MSRSLARLTCHCQTLKEGQLNHLRCGLAERKWQSARKKQKKNTTRPESRLGSFTASYALVANFWFTKQHTSPYPLFASIGVDAVDLCYAEIPSTIIALAPVSPARPSSASAVIVGQI